MTDIAPTRRFDVGTIGVTRLECPLLPDAVLTDPLAGRLDPRTWFADPTRPFEIEIGPGKGAFIVNQCAAEPETNFLAIEWEGEIYAYCADRLRRRQAGNVRVLHGNAVDFLKWRVPDNIVRVVHLYFSDPWPKYKHHKNRVIQDAFLAQVFRVLVPGGELRVVTDHDELWEWDCEHFGRWTAAAGKGVPEWISQVSNGPPFIRGPFVSPKWVVTGEVLGTNFERKFQRDDRPAHSCVLRRS